MQHCIVEKVSDLILPPRFQNRGLAHLAWYNCSCFPGDYWNSK